MKDDVNFDSDVNDNDIAIVGMAAHLPGAGSIGEYWTNLRDGVESIRQLSEEDLLAAGEELARIRQRNYVAATAPLEGFEQFDADFFGFSPKEAAIMDPQHRQFLEVVWETLENAGHPPENFPGPIGVFAGCGMGSYFYFNICSNSELVDSTGMFLLRHTGNDKDFLSTRVSHVFDLKGPSISLQTACSTSLVTVHYAIQALLSGECDMAIAGGVTIDLPQGRGYIFKEGEVLSPDGHCHAFDHRAQGTVFGSGAGAVALRRLSDAIRDGDHIWAVIKGTAVNNDGAAKAGYLAPSVDGQARAIAESHAVAGVTADTIEYVECHGTGTYLGDPIEVAALTAGFRETTQESGFCRIGSVKTNIGHLDTAAGVASLIKAALALHHKQLPPSLGFEKPNPAIDFETSPFRVNTQLIDWAPRKQRRRAGVNSLGVGGTNAHAVLEEAPRRADSEPSDWPSHILTISGRSRAALDANANALAAHLRANPDQPLADVAYTLKEGRRAFEKRRVVVAESHEEAASLLESNDRGRVFTHNVIADPKLVFMFPGGGAQYAGMARDLYDTEPVFREWMDKGLDILQPKLDYDLRAIWLPETADHAAAVERLKQPSVQLPLLMIVEYALAQLWMSWGVHPTAMVGHSMGENTAACVAGVLSFEDCISLVHLRGSLLDEVPPGGMLSVPMDGDELEPLLDGLDLASANAPQMSVASGPQAALDALEARLKAQGIDCQRVPIDIAAHSRMLEPILGRFRDFLQRIQLNPPSIPFVSNRTGTYITDAEATDPEYWVGHLRNTVRFADCIATLAQQPGRVYLEVGPGKTLGSLTRAHESIQADQVLSSLRHAEEKLGDDVHFLGVIGRLWALGVDVDWEQIWGDAKRQRVPLPTYAFQRNPYFIEPGASVAIKDARPLRVDDIATWGYRPVWRPKLADCEIDVEADLASSTPHTWLIFADETGVASRVITRLRANGHRVIEVYPGDAFARTGEDKYVLAPERGREGYDELIRDLVANGAAPSRLAHFWLVTARETFRPGGSFFHRNQEQGFFSLLFLAQAIGDENLPKPLHLSVFTSGAAQVRDEAVPYPEKATAAGPVRVIPHELPGITCSKIDLQLPQPSDKLFGGRIRMGLADPFAGRRSVDAALDGLANRVLEDLLATPRSFTGAYRGDKRYELQFRPQELAETEIPVAREGGTYLITGGFGGVGLSIAEQLARAKANIILLARQPLPARETWERRLRGRGALDSISKRIAAVQHLESLGATVMVAVADVCNLEQMRGTVTEAKDRFGAINGLVHAAGIIDDGPLLAKSSSSVEDVFAPKIHGMQVIDALFPDGALDWMALFSSTSTVTAPAGQVDYVAANEYLNAYAKSRAGGQTKVVAINWGIWTDVGMAADALAKRLGPPADAAGEPAGTPLLDTASFDAAGHRIFTTKLSPERHWVLDEHRTLAGDALIPGTGYLEIAAEALQANGETDSFEIRNLFFLRPLQVANGRDRTMRVRLARTDEGYALQVQSASTVDGRAAFETNAQGAIALLPLAVPAPIDLDAVRARCSKNRVGDGSHVLKSAQEAHLRFGPRWRVLRTMAFGEGEGVADLALPKALARDVKKYPLHPGLLDLATGWAMELITGYTPESLWVPVSYRSVRVHRPLPAEIVSWVRGLPGNSAEMPFATFDVTICDPEGNVVLEVKGFTIKRLEGAFSVAPPKAREVEFEDSASQQPLSLAEDRLAHNLSQGIRPEEGAEAFQRALAYAGSQIVVSSMPLGSLIAQAAESGSAEVNTGQKFERPELDTSFLEPRNDVERTLAGFWQELLGISRVGVEDSFFDLGGHSLIAVRLFSMIKKAYRVEFPISVLFEAPTVAKCAALISERIAPHDSIANSETDAVEKPAERRFKHLVAMHNGEGGPRTPFFLVAGMFGNVLNLRHLAHLVGSDRPFYGLQARGLYGDEAPHATIPEAAADYIKELRVVQPRGPYLLGGFSGGGITAFEMAQQLTAAGEEVALLVLLDTPLPVRPSLNRRDKALIKAQEIRAKGPGYFVDWAKARASWELGRLRARFEGPGGTATEHQFHNAEIEAAFRSAVAQYQLQPWDGRVVLFRPPLDRRFKVSNGRWVSEAREYVFPDNEWTQWAPALQVFEVPGDHDSMVLEPNVRVLAAETKRCVEAAEASAFDELSIAAE